MSNIQTLANNDFKFIYHRDRNNPQGLPITLDITPRHTNKSISKFNVALTFRIVIVFLNRNIYLNRIQTEI